MSSWEYLTIWRHFLPTSWNTEYLIIALHPELLQGVLEESSCHGTWGNPCRGRRQAPVAVPVCGGQNPKAGPVSIPGAHRAPPHPTPLHAQATLSNTSLPWQTPAQMPLPLCGLPIQPSWMALSYLAPYLDILVFPVEGFFTRPDLGFLKGRNHALRFVSASSKY